MVNVMVNITQAISIHLASFLLSGFLKQLYETVITAMYDEFITYIDGNVYNSNSIRRCGERE